MEPADRFNGDVDDPIWRSEEFVQQRIDFLENNFPLTCYSHDWESIYGTGITSVIELRYADSRAVLPLIDVLNSAIASKMIIPPENLADIPPEDSRDPSFIIVRENSEFYNFACEGLGAIGDERAVEPIYESISGENYSPYMMTGGFEALRLIGTDKAIKRLFDCIEIVHNIEDKYEKNHARDLLKGALFGIQMDRGGIHQVISVLEDDGRLIAREYAAKTLGNSKDPRAIQALVETIAREREREVRYDAIQALERTQHSQGIHPLIHGFEEVLDALNDPELYVKIAATEALGGYQNEDAVMPIISFYEDYRTPCCLQSLASIGGEDAISYLIDLLKRPEEKDRLEAARSLDLPEHGERAVEALVESITGKTHCFGNLEMLEAVIDSLATIAWFGIKDEDDVIENIVEKKAERALVDLIEDENPKIRYIALIKLGKNMVGKEALQEELCIEALRKATNDPDEDVRSVAEWYMSNHAF